MAELEITSQVMRVPMLRGGVMSFYPRSNNTGSSPCDDVEFVVDRDKRTVVALIRWITTKNVWARGIAKCAPGECFNVHIGRAIALRRALGLEVPAEYTQCPPPSEPRNYDRVQFEGVVYTLTPTEDIEGTHGTEEAQVTSPAGRFGLIIDDSREEVAE